MVIKTLEQYEQALLRFKTATPAFIQCAKDIGVCLSENRKNDAKRILREFADKNNLVRWEQLALCDLSTIEKEKLEAGL
jgi:hypothetical protein